VMADVVNTTYKPHAHVSSLILAVASSAECPAHSSYSSESRSPEDEKPVDCEGEDRLSLHYAVEIGSVDTVRKLVELHPEKVDIFAVTRRGDTALHIAARKHDLPMAQFLISLGCDPHVANDNDETPLSLVTVKSATAAETLILSYFSMLRRKVDSRSFEAIAVEAIRRNRIEPLVELSKLGVNLGEFRTAGEAKSLNDIAQSFGNHELARSLQSPEKLEECLLMQENESLGIRRIESRTIIELGMEEQLIRMLEEDTGSETTSPQIFEMSPELQEQETSLVKISRFEVRNFAE